VTVATEIRARLSARTVRRARGAVLPAYDRASGTGLTHIGVGAFARAHLGTYMDDLLTRGHAAALWRGVSLRSRRAEEQLAPQDCYYSVTEREPGSEPALRVIGSLASVATGPAAAMEALTVPTTELVTVTITEKGYDPVEVDPTGADDMDTAPGVLAQALARWRDSEAAPPVIVPLDNVADNGRLLRARVTDVAARLEPRLAEWIHATVRFSNSVVDRMAPATTAGDLDAVSERLGLVDLAAVVTEHHRSWVVEGDDRLAPLERVGVQLVGDVTPFEQRKLWLLNAPHLASAYCGLLFGCPTIADTAANDVAWRFAGRLVDDLIDGAALPAALAPDAFAREALRRFRNPYLGHACTQVAADGSRKLPQRFGPVVDARKRRGLPNDRAAMVLALWVAAVCRLDVPGGALPAIADPDAARLAAAARRDLRQLAHVALSGRFDDDFVADVARALEGLVHAGAASVEALA
jgi:fructuronate reductase